MFTNNILNTSNGFFDEFRKTINAFIDQIENEQTMINKAFYEALPMEQRTVFLQTLEGKGVKRKRMEKITGKDQSTISRTINRQ